MKKTQEIFITPLSFGLEENGRLDKEARARYDRALHFVRRESSCVFVLSGGMGKFARKRGVPNLATAGERYLRERQWKKRIVNKGMLPDTNTVDEMFALRASVSNARTLWSEKKHVPRVATSWWHAPRVWCICLILFGRPVRVHMSRTTLSWKITLREIIFHECPAFPRSCLQAWRKR